jgi:hypothetical protein
MTCSVLGISNVTCTLRMESPVGARVLRQCTKQKLLAAHVNVEPYTYYSIEMCPSWYVREPHFYLSDLALSTCMLSFSLYCFYFSTLYVYSLLVQNYGGPRTWWFIAGDLRTTLITQWCCVVLSLVLEFKALGATIDEMSVGDPLLKNCPIEDRYVFGLRRGFGHLATSNPAL